MNRLSLIAASAAMTAVLSFPAMAGWTDVAQRPANPLRSPSSPRGSLYAVVPSHEESASYDRAFFGTLDPLTGQLNPIRHSSMFRNGEDYLEQSGAVRDGILYIPEFFYDEIGMVTGEYTIRWKRYDIRHDRELEPLIFGRDQDALKMYFYSMTYDPTADRFYGLSLDLQTGNGGSLVAVDCSADEWRPELLANVGGSEGNFMSNIVYNPADGKLYGLKDHGAFYEIDPEKGNVYQLMQYDDLNDFYTFTEAYTSVPICYSPYDKAYIYIFRDGEARTFRVISIDAETYEAIELSELYPMGYVSTLYCSDAYAPDDAPDRIDIESVDFEGTSLSGSYTLRIPSTTFGGSDIDSDLTLHILVDDAAQPTQSVRPGSTVGGTLDLTQGLHTLTVYASSASGDGPRSEREFYVGHDRPLPPTELSLSKGILSWQASAAIGEHGGAIDTADLTYDIYVDGKKFNDSPVSTTSIPFSVEEKMDHRSEISVTATAHATVSEHSAPLSRVIGRGDSLPAEYLPTEEEAGLFDTFNVTGDNYEFAYTTSGANPCFRVYTTDYNVAPDDWLFLPPVYLDSADALYDLSFTYVNAAGNERHLDNLDIFVGRDPLPGSMDTPVYSHERRSQPEPTGISATFSVAEAGTYYIGFHSRPGDDTRYRGIKLYDFAVAKGEGSTLAPAEATEASVAGAPLGALAIDVEATLPTKAINGSTLSSDTKITLTAAAAGHESSASGAPGEKVKFSLPVDASGTYAVALTASSDKGSGRSLMFDVFAGVDTPLPPANVKGVVSDDNLTVDLTWDPVPEVGVNGGYVNPEEVSYDIYTQSSTGATLIAHAGSACSYSYSIGAGSLQNGINVGPVAVNSTGNSTGGTFFYDLLGDPYHVPMKEEFGASKFDYQKWSANTQPGFSAVQWTPCSSTTGLGIGDPVFGVVGGLRAETTSPTPVWGELIAPKGSTIMVAEPQISIRYWDYPGAAEMELWGRTCTDQEYRRIAELKPAGKSGQWVDWILPLPEEFVNQGWIQINLRALMDDSKFLLIDNYRLIQDIEYDYAVTSLKAPYSSILGDEATFDVTVANAGTEPVAGELTVELLGDGEVLASEKSSVGRLAAGDTYEHSVTFPMIEAYLDAEKIEVRATARSNDDTNPYNDTMTSEFILLDNAIPTVRDLSGGREGESIALTWSAPSTRYDGPESFEPLTPFLIADRIGDWQNVDLDGKAQFAIEGAVWGDNVSEPCAWMVFDAEAMGTMHNDRLSPHSGRHMLIARSIQYADGEQPEQNSDWLISPEVEGGSRVSFWMNCISSQYPETVQIWYSTTGTRLDLENAKKDSKGNIIECGDFKKVRNFTKSGEDTWELCEATLPADARYFALVYASYGDFAAMIDDITYSPAADRHSVIDSYDVVFIPEGGSEETVAHAIASTSHTIAEADPHRGDYYVAVNVKDNGNLFRGALSNPAHVDGSGVEIIDGDLYIGAGNGRILIGGAEGRGYTVADAEGRVIASGIARADREIVEVPAGIILVTVGNRTAKLIVR